MSEGGDIKFGIVLDVIDNASNSLKNVGSAVTGLGGMLKGLLGHFNPVIDVIHLVKIGFDFLWTALKAGPAAAAEYEDSITKLSGAMKSQGIYTKEALEHSADFADKMQETTKFTDDQTLATQTLLVSLGKLKGEGLDKATAAAADLATGLGINMDAAGRMLARVLESDMTHIKGLPIAFTGAAGSAEKFNSVMKGIQGAFGGRAVSDANTFSGSLIKMRNAWDDVIKTFGAANIDFLKPVVDGITKGLGLIQPKIIPFIKWVEDIGIEVKGLLRNLSIYMIHFIGAPLDPDNYVVAAKGLVNFFNVVGGTVVDCIAHPIKNAAEMINGFAAKVQTEVKNTTSLKDQIVASNKQTADEIVAVNKKMSDRIAATDKSTVENKKITGDELVTLTNQQSAKLITDLETRLGVERTKKKLTIDQEIAAYEDLASKKVLISTDEDKVHDKLLLLRAQREADISTYIGGLWDYMKDQQINSLQDAAVAMKKISKKMFHDYIQGVEQKIIADTAAGIANALSHKATWGMVPWVAAQGGAQLVVANAADNAVQGLETGGIVSSEGLYTVGEKNRKEAVIPLESGSGKKALSDALAAAGSGAGAQEVTVHSQMIIEGDVFDLLTRKITNNQAKLVKQGRL